MKRLIIASVFIAITTPALADEYVNGYMRKDGTYVQPYHRTSPDSNPYNNYSTQGNTNPYTGQAGTVNPNPQYQQPYNPNNNSQYNSYNR